MITRLKSFEAAQIRRNFDEINYKKIDHGTPHIVYYFNGFFKFKAIN
jgi:hypothetical protein